MASSFSVNAFSLNSQSELHHSKTLISTVGTALKHTNPSQAQKPLSLHKSPRPVHLSSISCFQFPVIQKSSSNPSLLKKLSMFCAERIAVFLVGSFIFAGFLGCKPAIALPVQKGSYSEKIEEKRETQIGDSDEQEMYAKLLEGDPRNVEALKLVVNGKMRKGKTKEALQYVERLIDVQPEEVEWRLLQALCYEMMGQLSKAKRLFKEILAQRPLLLRALHALAMVMHKNHEGPAIFDMLGKALEVAHSEQRVNEERNIRILIAQMHVVKGELEEGLKNFQTLVDENPRDFRPYLCRGIIYSLMERKKEAEENFELFRSLVPDEYPQRVFLDDVVLAAKTSSQQQFEKEFRAQFPRHSNHPTRPGSQ
ncbi:protein SLOW GREEN 1, chloroplastic isoform X1 [Diospyros lotus]|uniref:protein SLOW GREEN 1, chloroplastic isoform X1 n=1 Tax=Diospyros lotus TaxID=55363 RepID=UPI00224C8A95|nr:protein SLOW GREEN 1, chloroplastic isoform X1 [Diospyros lotus]